MALANPIEAVTRDPLWAARESARPVVALASNNVPIELIHGAGCFPLQLPTAPRADTARADRYMESRFDPMTRAALEQLLAGELDCVRLLVLPRTIDSWQRLYYYLCELTRSFGERLPETFLYDLLHTPFATSAEYNLASTRVLAERLARLVGAPLDARALVRSIALYDRVREKLRAVRELRRSVPCRLPGVDALALYDAFQRLEPEVFEQALDGWLRQHEQPAPGVRTLLVGSAHDTPALHAMVARAGGQVVADHHWRGDLLLMPRVQLGDDPVRALAEHYHRHSSSVRTFPSEVEPLLAMAEASRAEAVVFFYYDEEEALTWEYPEQSTALRRRGLPTLLVEREAYPPSAGVEDRLRAFFAERVPR